MIPPKKWLCKKLKKEFSEFDEYDAFILKVLEEYLKEQKTMDKEG